MSERGDRQELVGTVRSASMMKSVVVTVEALTRHSRYEKVVRRTRKFMAHDEADTCRVGDTVRIMESRPLSRRKRWRVVEVIRRAPEVGPALTGESTDASGNG